MEQAYQETRLPSQLSNRLIGVGMALFFVGLLILWGIAAYLKYSDKVTGTITMTTDLAPLECRVPSSGALTLLVKDEAVVKEGQTLAIIDNAADMEDVEKLEIMLSQPDFELSTELQLGSIQSTYNNFLQAQLDYQNLRAKKSITQQIASKSNQIELYEARLNLLQQKEGLVNENTALASRQAASKQRLAKDATIATAEFERAVQAKLDREFDALSNQEAINLIEIRVAELQSDIADLRAQNQEELATERTKVQVAKANVQAAIKDWKQNNLIRARRDGRFILQTNIENGYFAQAEEVIGRIVPKEENAYLGRVQIQPRGIAKVKVGQTVNIFLSDYPESEFGILKGNVAAIATLPEDDLVQVQVQLPEDLTSTYGIPFDIRQLGTGRAEIITNKMSFAQRIVNEFRDYQLNE
ncbi:MAG: HlyD family efflux transporter periplasmic adaptor subunit [Bacteroidota bacterium]